MLRFIAISLLVAGVGSESLLEEPESVTTWDGEAGHDSVAHQTRVMGGFEALPAQFPYQAALRIDRDGHEFQSLCGGSLISKEAVVTAAHCVDRAVRVQVDLGLVHLDDPADQSFLVVPGEGQGHILLHPGWSRQAKGNDIALLILPQDVIFNALVSPIPLTNYTRQMWLLGKKATISGWGVSRFLSSSPSGRLKWAQVRVLPWAPCNLVLLLGSISPQIVCTTSSLVHGSNVCSGDSGGPVTIKTNNRTELIGVVSFGFPLCSLRIPAGHSFVGYYLDWIKSTLNKFTTSSQ